MEKETTGKGATKLVNSLALAWGVALALLLQTPRGRRLADERTHYAVIVGVGVDLLLLALVLPRKMWRRVATVIALSAVGPVARSQWNERMSGNPAGWGGRAHAGTTGARCTFVRRIRT